MKNAKGIKVIVQGVVAVLLAAGNVILGIKLFDVTNNSDMYEVIDEEAFKDFEESGCVKKK